MAEDKGVLVPVPLEERFCFRVCHVAGAEVFADLVLDFLEFSVAGDFGEHACRGANGVVVVCFVFDEDVYFFVEEPFFDVAFVCFEVWAWAVKDNLVRFEHVDEFDAFLRFQPVEVVACFGEDEFVDFLWRDNYELVCDVLWQFVEEKVPL